VVVGLLGMVYVMNIIQQKRLDEHAALEKAAKEARQKAEGLRAGKLSPAAAHSAIKSGPASFPIPKPAGPESAPIQIDVFLDGTNSCHATSTELVKLSSVYGKSVHVDFLDMSKPEVAKRADKLQLGCAAGLAINEKVELTLNTPNGKRVITYRGPANMDQYRTADVYLAVNTLLAAKGIGVPAEAKKLAVGAGAYTPAGGHGTAPKPGGH
jgi:hypothetical protein